jgi:divalent metal cation (Fe/Co/Zn/Cd) transporter
MIGALAFSVVPPVILGRKKSRIARRLHDKVLYVDARTSSADWQTGAASIVGIAGIALGAWWADAAMASLVSMSVLRDGVTALKGSTISLVDGMPRRLDSHEVSDDALSLQNALETRFPGSLVKIRETGRFLRAELVPTDAAKLPRELAGQILGADSWRLLELCQAVREHPRRRQDDT